MGYATDFEGSVAIDPPLNPSEIDYLRRFAESRRMQRHGGPYDVSEPGRFSPEIIEYNYPPEGQHSLWCDWEPTADGAAIAWNRAEKFYDADAWMRYLIDTFLRPGATLQGELADPVHGRVYDPAFAAFTFDHTANGTIEAQGEDPEDTWRLVVTDNRVERVDASTEAQAMQGAIASMRVIEAAQAEDPLTEARDLARRIFAAATELGERPWSMAALADVDPGLETSQLPDWLTIQH